MAEGSDSKAGAMALLFAAVSAWLIYDMATATETPSMTLRLMQYVFLAGTLIGAAGMAVKFLSAK